MKKLTDKPWSDADVCDLTRDLLRMGKSVRFQARGMSMKPLVRDGDILLIEPLGQRLPRLGDVVLCQTAKGRVLAHRVIGRQGKPGVYTYLIQGDRAAHSDGWMELEQIWGRVSKLERGDRVINLENPFVKALGKYAAYRSRFCLGGTKLHTFGAMIAKKLPFIGTLIN
ncbi:MAG: S24/S26 family peptidase [Brevefilum sp.]|nr:S24/S26 family peptidase [Brevefilum sp.]